MKHLKRFNESVLGKLMDSDRGRDSSELYKFLGETNSGTWLSSLTYIIKNKTPIDMSEDDINHITGLFNKKTARTDDESNPIQYPCLKSAVNSRFSYCWFVGKIDKDSGFFSPLNWDICIQPFEDEWYLVNIGSGNAWYNYWYICDTREGLDELIKYKLYDETLDKI